MLPSYCRYGRTQQPVIAGKGAQMSGSPTGRHPRLLSESIWWGGWALGVCDGARIMITRGELMAVYA